MLLKPRWLPCLFLKWLDNNKCLVKVFGKNIEVKSKNLQLIKLPLYEKC